MTTEAGWAIIRILVATLTAACIGRPSSLSPSHRAAHVRPGITVLLEDSIALVRGKRIALLTNRTGVDAHGASDIDLLAHSPARLVLLFSPEHGIRGAEDRMFIASGVDSATGLPVVSLFGRAAVAPPDSLLAGLDALVIDLQDVGTRTWTYVGSMLYAMRAAAGQHVPVIVLDRPNPLTGAHVDGPILDSAVASLDVAYALYPMPLRHGLTMGELARFYNDTLALHATLHVMPADGWRRELWFDETHLPWVRPSPNLPSPESELLYPALVAFEGSNLSVGRGTDDAFQQLGAPWLDAARAVAALDGLGLAGVRFRATTFVPVHPTDGKYSGRRVPAVRVEVTDRDRVQVGRVSGALLWAVARANADSLRLDTLAFDVRFGRGALRRALIAGGDPDAILDRELPAVIAFERRTRRFRLYH
jgi:uncharacterized protein YbbC (DUF1343 family)